MRDKQRREVHPYENVDVCIQSRTNNREDREGFSFRYSLMHPRGCSNSKGSGVRVEANSRLNKECLRAHVGLNGFSGELLIAVSDRRMVVLGDGRETVQFADRKRL